MTDKHKKLLSDLDFRLHQLMYLCDSLKEDNISLKKQLEVKTIELKEVSTQLNQLKIKYNNLKIATTITNTDDSEGVEVAKQRLAKLVHDVEKCIALLKI